MGDAVMIRYQTRPDAAEQNQELVEKVFADLAATSPAGLRYTTFRLDDGVTFVHIVIAGDGANPLAESAAFAEFQRGIAERVVAPPERSDATLVGSYNFALGTAAR